MVDVFAIGVLMFLAASNIYPFQDEEQTRTRDVFIQELVRSHRDLHVAACGLETGSRNGAVSGKAMASLGPVP